MEQNKIISESVNEIQDIVYDLETAKNLMRIFFEFLSENYEGLSAETVRHILISRMEIYRSSLDSAFTLIDKIPDTLSDIVKELVTVNKVIKSEVA